MKFAVLFLVAVFSVNFAVASRILFLFPSPSKSHLIVVKGLSTTLAERGHDVTVASPFPLDKPMKNYRDIKVEVAEDFQKLTNEMVSKPNLLKMFPRLLSSLSTMGNEMINLPEFQKMMKEEKFDLVVVGMFFNTFLLGIGDHFKCPTIMLSVTSPMTATNVLMGNPLGVTSVRHQFFGSDLKSFSDRIRNFLAHGVDFLMMAYSENLQKKNYELNFPSDQYISYEEATKNLSLILFNSHFSQGQIRPMVPAMVEVGGLQVNPTPSRLPEKIQAWLDGATHGAIFFSLGSNAKTTFLPREKIDILLNVFSKLKQRVIMKWESDELEGRPDNVFIGKWLPQDSILAHPNLKIFISHCGLGSISESKYHGVPVIAMPLAIDQTTNADSIVAEGWAEKMDFGTLNQKDLETTLQRILQNPKYANTAKRQSELYRDRPMNARDTATFWVEYVIRHRGAPHLRYPGADLNFWQSKSVDVVLFLLAALYIIYKIFAIILKFLVSKICKTEKKLKRKTN